MKTSIEQLTDLELATYNSYIKILELCHEPLTNDQMRSKGMKYIRNTITYKCKHLIEKGYLLKINETNARGKYSTYKTIVSQYPLQEYLDFINAKHYNQVGIRHKIVERKNNPPTTQTIYINKYDQLSGNAASIPIQRGNVPLDMGHIEAQQIKSIPKRKAPKVYAGHWGYQNA